jgi:predicted RNase H-like HicB family nuclease
MLNAAVLVMLPWTWVGPALKSDGDTKYYELTIKELPDFAVMGDTRDQVVADMGEALESFLGSYIEEGKMPPLPEGISIATIRARPQPELLIQVA